MTVRTRSRRHPRTLQRALHVVAGIAMLAHIYLTPAAGSLADVAVRWGAAPAVVISGLVLWQGPKIKRRIRSRRRRAQEAA